MFSFIKGLIAKRNEAPEAKPSTPNTVEPADWQRFWHDQFDTDTELLALDEMKRPSPLPEDIEVDFRLIHCLGLVTETTREACFSIFPKGNEMHRMLTGYLNGKHKQLTPDEAKSSISKLAELIDNLKPDEQVNWSKICITDFNSPTRMEDLSQTDSVTYLLESTTRIPSEYDTISEEQHIDDAVYFLREPLYAIAGNYYHVSDYIFSIFDDIHHAEIYSRIYNLWIGGWSIYLANEGIILEDRRKLRN